MDEDAQAAMAAVGRAAAVNTEHRPVVISEGVVTRPAAPTSSTVHSYLPYLRGKGLRCVPDPIAVGGRLERLRYLHGSSGGEGWYHQHTEQELVSAARLLRTIHDAGRDWTPPAEAVWGALPVAGEDVVYCHGDPGPWNFVWEDREATGLIDWTTCTRRHASTTSPMPCTGSDHYATTSSSSTGTTSHWCPTGGRGSRPSSTPTATLPPSMWLTPL